MTHLSLIPIYMTNTEMKYFTGLNSLRFLAALFVAVSHTSVSLVSHHATYVYDFSMYSFFQNGHLSVEFFFVLSGFLITSLLLNEYRLNGFIDIKKFYFRRVIRIWPLYYLIVFFYFIMLPILCYSMRLHFETHLSNNSFIWYLIFLPNVAWVINPQTLLGPLWSIGVEEQFYLLWAPVVHFFKTNLLPIFCGIILIKMFFNIFFVDNDLYTNTGTSTKLILFISRLKFESMAIGGLGACLTQHVKKVSCVLFNPLSQIIVLSFLCCLLFFKSLLQEIPFGKIVLDDSVGIVIRSFLFLYLIINVSLNSKALIKFQNKRLSVLGNYSYGIYMYHITVEMFLLNFMKPVFSFENEMMSTIFYYIIFIGLTIFVSYLSYHLIEKRFLKLKKSFQPTYCTTTEGYVQQV